MTLISGCAPILPPEPAPLFKLPLSIEGEFIGSVIIDTGGAYELMLRDGFGLALLGSVEVLAFGGREVVDVTEGFDYSVGGFDSKAETALVGLSVCDCNGLGFDFFRKTGKVLALDFPSLQASFLPAVAEDGVVLAYRSAPHGMSTFDSAFIEVEVTSAGVSRNLVGLLDTGTNSTMMRRGLFDNRSLLAPDLLPVMVSQPDLGVVAVSVRLFGTEGLPDLIIGTDVMRAWGDRWYFSFEPSGGTVTVVPAGSDGGEEASAASPPAAASNLQW